MNYSEVPITDKEVRGAESIFLPIGVTFDEERCKVLKSMETIDIKAAPGSGKTTVLLAKLFILAQRMPFKDGKGICVLTHTNVAIDEIKSRLGSKADILFSYPNFFGTFQSFVDKFLAIPYYAMRTNSRSIMINNKVYEEKLNNKFNKGLKNYYSDSQKRQIQTNSKYYVNSNTGLLNQIRLKVYEGKNILTKGISGENIEIKRPSRSFKKKGDFSVEEKEDINRWLLSLKLSLLNDGVLCYDDAYYLAEVYIKKYEAQLNNLFSNRFKFVFIDESQDTYSHQNWIIEKLFNEQVVIQKFGDPNQAIFESGKSNHLLDCKNPKRLSLEISQSQRFGDSIANKLSTICIDKNNQIVGNSQIKSFKPHIILFKNEEISYVLETFVELIKKNNLHIFQHENALKEFKAIGWRGSTTSDVTSKLCLSSYFPNFNKKNVAEISIQYKNLISYIKKFPAKVLIEKGVKIYYDSIINSILRYLYLADIKNMETNGNRYFTKSSLLKFLKDNYIDEHSKLKIKLTEWIYSIHNDQEEFNTKVYKEIKNYLQKDIKSIWPTINELTVKEFLENSTIEEFEPKPKYLNSYRSPTHPEIEIKVDTVHSVKGETHKATLYLETYFNKIHDLRKILPFLKGLYDEKLLKRATIQEALKIAHVGMSRPTHLLCIAMNSEGLTDSDINDLEKHGWEIVRIKSPAIVI